MSLPSPGPVDALITWAQFKDLFERGIIQDPILYSGLTSLGSKFTVRRKVIMTRGLRTILTNRLTLQSVIITDSQGSVPVAGTGFIIGYAAAATGVFRFTNPKGSGKRAFINEIHAALKVATTTSGVTEVLINAPVSPAGTVDLTVSPIATTPGPSSMMLGGAAVTPATVQGFTVRYFEWMLNAGVNFTGSQVLPVPDLILPPDSSLDIDVTSFAGTSVKIIIDWTEQ